MSLALFASRQKNTYLPNQQLWLNKLYFQISNSKNKQCLTIDTRDVNELGPGKFRTSAENGEEQTCYFNRNKSDTHFTSFFARRSQADPIRFSIVKPNSNFELVNKSLDFKRNKSVLNVKIKRTRQSVNSEYFSNGRSESDSFTQRRDLFSQTTKVRRDRRNSRDESASTREKPRFLSNR